MSGLPWALYRKQVLAVLRLELRKNFLSRRGWWIWLLAGFPAFICVMHGLLSRSTGHDLGEDTKIFAGIFQLAYLRFAIYFGCVGIFMNLVRGDVLEKTLHYYFLAPVRREVVMIGKYLAGLAVAAFLFGGSTLVSFYFIRYHYGSEFQQWMWNGPGLGHMGWYLVTAALACLGYGAVFLLMGLLVRNPMIPAAVVMVWEGINNFLPAFLQQISVIYYLKSLTPVNVVEEGPLAMLAVTADPAPAWLAITGVVLVSGLLVLYAAVRSRRFEISYAE